MIDRRTVLGAAAALALGRSALAQPASADGVWHGTLQTAGPALRLRLEIRPDGAVILNSLDQGGAPIPGRVISREASQIVIESPAISLRLTARLEGPDRLDATVTQGGADLPMTLARGEPPTSAATTIYSSPPAALTTARLAAYRAAENSPALAAASRRRGGEAHYWSTGVRRYGSPQAVTDTDQWHIGSQAKSMTATLVACLVEAGRVRWDDTVGGTLATIAPQMRAEYRPVTLRHLLSHRAGLPGNLAMADIGRFQQTPDDVREDRRAWVRLALAMPPIGAPAAAFEYANNGYITAAAMLETKLGESWESLIRRHVFEPFRLSSAGFGPPGRAGAVEQPFGHVPNAGTPLSPPDLGGMVDFPGAMAPAGLVHIGLADLLTYLAAQRDRPSLLRAESWTALHTPPFGGDYAMGWAVRPDGVLWHNGSNRLWYSEMAFSASRGWIAAAVSNYGGAQRAVGRTLMEAALAA
jgi:CubicO group peptidase (beta-lactamase class C family)